MGFGVDSGVCVGLSAGIWVDSVAVSEIVGSGSAEDEVETLLEL